MITPRSIGRRLTKRMLVAGGIAIATAGIGGATIIPGMLASAATPTPSTHSATAAGGSGTKAQSRGAVRGLAAKKLVAIVAKDTGLSTTTIKADLKAGKSLDTIAGAHAAAVKSDALAALKSALDARVAAGKLTAAKETTLLAKAPAALDTIMSRDGLGSRKGGARARISQAAGQIRKAVVAEVEQQTGLTQQAIAADVKAGKSLDDILGSKAAAAKTALLAELKTKLDAAVTAGKLTSAQETKLVAAAPKALDKLMAAHRGQHKAPTSPTA